MYTVVMPAYNAEAFLREAIDSVLCQTMNDFELIIIDDGSTDKTLSIAREYLDKDFRVVVLTQPNAGTAPTLNRGIKEAANEWIFIMHADDLMQPNRLERQIAFVNEHPELAVASSLVRHIDQNGRIIGKDNSKLTTHQAVEEMVQKGDPIGFNHPAVALRKSAATAVGGYRQDFWPAEDIDLWNRLIDAGYKILVQPEFLLDYRIHGKSASVSRSRLTRQKMRWLKDSMLRRRRNQPELTWDQFLAERRKDPLFRRVNEERTDMARIFYKAAVAHYAEKRYIQTMANALLAVCLRPKVMTTEVLTKLNLSSS